MRNLKRVLSLALAAIMLMGMMVIGTSAASVNDFPDVDQIDDYAKEAVAITTGLGIFSGEAGTGKFNPNGTVTRAQLATIICKILVLDGTINYDLLKGSSSFADARTYQSGWAEGYINYCHATGIVNGYNSTTYGAAEPVITWHAALALERAVGYYLDPVKNGESLNETVVTSKGIEIGLYGDMSLSVDHVLTRQELAVMIYNALFAQRVHFDNGRYVKDSDWNVTVNNATVDPYNTLAYGTFYLVAEDGIVMRNSATDPTLASTDKLGAGTAVDMYDETHEKLIGEKTFEYETGTDLVGHAVTVYYSVAHKVKNTTIPEKVYAMTDQATATGMITYETLSNGTTMDYTSMNRAAVALGFKNRTLGSNVEEYNINYDLNAQVKDTMFNAEGVKVKKGDYILLVSNQPSKEVDYAIVLKQYADTITISTDRASGEETARITTVPGHRIEDFYRQDALANRDKIIVTPNYFDGEGIPTYAVVQKAPTLSADVTEIRGKSVTTNSYKTVTASGVVYTESPALTPGNAGTNPFQTITQLGETTLVLDTFGQLIAIDQKVAKETTELVYVAQFIYKYKINEAGVSDGIGLAAVIYHEDGTSEVIFVNTDYTSLTEAGGDYTVTQTATAARRAAYWTDPDIIKALATGADTSTSLNIIDKCKDLNMAGKEPNAVTMAGTLGTTESPDKAGYDNGGTFLGVWNIREYNDGTYILTKPNSWKDDGSGAATGGVLNAADITGEDSANSDAKYTLSVHKTATNDSSDPDTASYVYIVKSHSTYLPNNTYNMGAALSDWKNTYADQGNMLKQTASTIYWMVDGNYGEDDFSVKAVKGIQNMDNVVLSGTPGTNDGTWAEEAWLTNGNNVLAMVIHGAVAVNDLGVCYYNEGDWDFITRNGKPSIDFKAYDVNGDEVHFVYEFDTADKALDAAKGLGTLVNPPEALTERGIPSGYYNFYSSKIVAVSANGQFAVDKDGHRGIEVLNGDSKKGTVYVANGALVGTVRALQNNNSIFNLFTNATPQGFIYESNRVVDLKENGANYTTVKAFVDDMDAEYIQNVKISYSYGRGEYYNGVLFLIDYDFKSIAKPEAPKPEKADTGIDYSDKTDVQVYTTSETKLTDPEAVALILEDLQEKYDEVVPDANFTDPDAPVWTFKCYSVSGNNKFQVAEFTYNGGASGGSNASGVKYTVDGDEVVGGTTYTAPDGEFAKVVTNNATTWTSAAGGTLTVADGSAVTTGYVKVTTGGTNLANLEEATGTYYAKKTTVVAAKDTVTATAKGTNYKNGSNYYAWTANKTYADLTAASGVVDVELGYFEVTAPGISTTAAGGVTLTGITPAKGYARASGTVAFTVATSAAAGAAGGTVTAPSAEASASYTIAVTAGGTVAANATAAAVTATATVTVTLKADVAANVTVAGNVTVVE